MSVLVPLAFLLGAIAGGLMAWRLRGRVAPASKPTRYLRLKLVASTVLATLSILAVAGYALIRHRFGGEQPSPASVNRAMDDFRKSGAGAQRGSGPPPGVYTYHGKGFFKIEAPLLGKKHLTLPKTIPAILRHVDKRCWELTVRPWAQHEWTERYCRHGPTGYRQQWRKNKSDMFGIKSSSTSECRPSALFDESGALRRSWEATCRVTKRKTSLPIGGKPRPTKVQITLVGKTKIVIGGRQVVAYHFRQTASVKRKMKGSMTREVWFDASTGMLLKLSTKGGGTGMAKVQVDQTYTLANLKPRR